MCHSVWFCFSCWLWNNFEIFVKILSFGFLSLTMPRSNTVLLSTAVVVVMAVLSTAATIPEQSPPAKPKIDWGKCPQLEPSETDLKSKSAVLQKCLEQFPVPAVIDMNSIQAHQRMITECALKSENWFDKDGSYRFVKAETEIKNKNLSTEMEKELITAHGVCTKESQEKFPDLEKVPVVDMVQFYQSCMDAHITKVCGIKISKE